MKRSSKILCLFGLLAAAGISTKPAHAQVTLTFVSGTGNDTTACSRIAPCRTFAGAIAKTAANGEIKCLDQDNFSAVTITKSLTIDCSATFGSIFMPGGIMGITINANAGDKVTIRGLSINGAGATIGHSGIHFLAGGELHVENVTFENYTGAGIAVEKSAPGILTVRNATFQRGAYGVNVTSSAPNVVASIDNSRFNNLSSSGVVARNNSYVSVSNSVFSTNNASGILAATATSTVYAENNVISNTANGISAAVAGAKINANGNSLYGNSKSFNVASGATFLSGGGNKLDINPGNPPTGSLTWR